MGGRKDGWSPWHCRCLQGSQFKTSTCLGLKHIISFLSARCPRVSAVEGEFILSSRFTLPNIYPIAACSSCKVEGEGSSWGAYLHMSGSASTVTQQSQPGRPVRTDSLPNLTDILVVCSGSASFTKITATDVQSSLCDLCCSQKQPSRRANKSKHRRLAQGYLPLGLLCILKLSSSSPFISTRCSLHPGVSSQHLAVNHANHGHLAVFLFLPYSSPLKSSCQPVI